VARLRNLLTRLLRWVLLSPSRWAGMGALDRLSWWILEEFQSGNQWLWRGVGAGGWWWWCCARWCSRCRRSPPNPAAARDWLPRLLNVGSMLGMLVLVSTWLVLLQWFVFAPETFDAMPGAGLDARQHAGGCSGWPGSC
jgi:hypothetical protein